MKWRNKVLTNWLCKSKRTSTSKTNESSHLFNLGTTSLEIFVKGYQKARHSITGRTESSSNNPLTWLLVSWYRYHSCIASLCAKWASYFSIRITISLDVSSFILSFYPSSNKQNFVQTDQTEITPFFPSLFASCNRLKSPLHCDNVV